MRLPRLAMISALAFSLSGCQTMVNGVDISPHPAQGGGSNFCERNMAVCVGGGVLLMGGVAVAAAGHSYRSGAMGMAGTGSGVGGGY